MHGLRKTIAGLKYNRARWEALVRGMARAALPDANLPSRLREVRNFGSNPGNLRMFTYVPPRLAAAPSLVVVLHGCKQSAGGYDNGSGWSTLADRYGFLLLFPEQVPANNLNCCFNWFQAADTRRGHGEALSIRQMVDVVVRDHKIDPSRVFITGLSAGGAMTSAMLACYPEVFAAGAIIAGLPHGAAANAQQAFESMFQGRPRPERTWGDLVRAASPHGGPWPRISVWHGEADTTVVPSNAREILKQWSDVHGLASAPSVRMMVDGHAREIWFNEAGEALIESYTISGMAHGTPLATGGANEACGNAGPFLLEAGISSSYRIARFFGLTAAGRARRVASNGRAASVAGQRIVPALATARNGRHRKSRRLETVRSQAPGARPGIVDVGAVINRALRTAGLIKEP